MQVFPCPRRLTGMHDESPIDLARILRFAATYMEEHGRARFRFGGGPGRAACPVAALALALGVEPRRVGWSLLFLPANQAQHKLGSVILRSGLLDRLPAPATAYGRRRPRRSHLTPVQAIHELARWSDDKALDAIVIGALRARAEEIVARSVWTRPSAGLTASARLGSSV